MKDLCRNSFLVDLGVDVTHSKQIAQLQKEYAFSEECYRFLLANDNTTVNWSSEELQFLEYGNIDSTINLLDVNEESIISPYVFFFARNGAGQLIGEITTGLYSGYIVMFNEEQFCDIDSLEELLEDCDVCVEALLGDTEEVMNTLLSESNGIMFLVAESFTEFISE